MNDIKAAHKACVKFTKKQPSKLRKKYDHKKCTRKLFHNGGPYHIETSPLICTANQWTGSYMKGTSVMKE